MADRTPAAGLFLSGIGAFVVGVVLSIPLSAWKAHVAIVLWGWFVTSSFGIAPPPLWQMAGLFTLASLASNWTVKTSVDDIDGYGWKVAFGVIVSLVGPALALLTGWAFYMLAGSP